MKETQSDQRLRRRAAKMASRAKENMDYYTHSYFGVFEPPWEGLTATYLASHNILDGVADFSPNIGRFSREVLSTRSRIDPRNRFSVAARSYNGDLLERERIEEIRFFRSDTGPEMDELISEVTKNIKKLNEDIERIVRYVAGVADNLERQ